MKSLQEIKDAGTRLMGNGFVDEGILLEQIFDDFLKLQEIIKSHNMICPYCLSPLEETRYFGYYDTFDLWGCKCDKLPNAEKNTCNGQYA